MAVEVTGGPKSLAGAVVIGELWRLAVALRDSESCVTGGQQMHSPIQIPSTVTPTCDNIVPTCILSSDAGEVILFAFVLVLVANTEYYDSLLFHASSLLISLQEMNIKANKRRKITKMHLAILYSKIQYIFSRLSCTAMTRSSVIKQDPHHITYDNYSSMI